MIKEKTELNLTWSRPVDKAEIDAALKKLAPKLEIYKRKHNPHKICKECKKR